MSVLVACSLAPVATDINGVIRLSNGLTRVEERLATLVTEKGTATGVYRAVDYRGRNSTHLMIPDHASWIITMWHFGVDSSVEYSGDKFSVTFEVGQNALIRAYSKIMKDKKTRIRFERQEYPMRHWRKLLKKSSVLEGMLLYDSYRAQRHSVISELL